MNARKTNEKQQKAIGENSRNTFTCKNVVEMNESTNKEVKKKEKKNNEWPLERANMSKMLNWA